MAKSDNNDKPVLSKREMEVLQAVSKGLSNQEIARELIISVNTVSVHLRNIFQKLDVQSRTEATMRGVQKGWISPQITGDDAGGERDTAASKPEMLVAPLPKLAAWQKIYFAMAAVAAVIVVSIPLIEPILGSPAGNPIVDSQPINNSNSMAVLESDRWNYQAEMPIARSRLALVSYNDQLYLIGGSRSSGPTGLVEIFTPGDNLWREAAGKPTLTANIQGVVINDQIYVAGGCTSDTEPTDQLEIFDPLENLWRIGAALPQPLCAYAATTIDNELYLIGGWNGADYVGTVYIYNPETNSWRLANQAYPLQVGFAAAAVVDGKIYVVGGYDGQDEYTDVNIFDSETEQWTAGPPLNNPRGGLGLVAVGENLYAVGGGWTNPLSTNERLSIDTGVWSEIETPYLNQWRNLGLAVVGSEIFAVGGWNGEHLNTVVSFKTVYKIFVPFSQ